MGLVPVNLINNQKKMLDLISARQEALGDNIVNTHTVGYKRKDVDFSQYLNSGISSTLEAKINAKYGPNTISGMAGGQNLPPEDELALMQQNYLLYNVAVRNLASTVTEIKTALSVSANG